ncbi:hypothetical protein AB6T85_20200 [Erwinia sp. ACCC 02193]|uniref:Uncharacterized protein n=1 Tax=Erwinia aeris TaxID=3239803 RepID=A0ABV4ECS3_9GAMM
MWDEHLASQTEVTAEPVAELPVEVAEEVEAVSAALAERISQLAAELNDKAVRAAERRVAEVTRAAGEQTAQAERELADAAQTGTIWKKSWTALAPNCGKPWSCLMLAVNANRRT